MFNIAIYGFGTVGGGVWQVLKKNEALISKKLGGNGEKLVDVKYVLDRRTFEGHEIADRVVTDINIILADPTVSVVVETMGGAHPAFEFSKAALESGKSVVTSNKEVVAKFGAELFECAARNGVSYLYEASVGGGIPIINALKNALTANRIDRIAGILNGTTNFILTEMMEKGTAFADALKEAQKRGYAEADPTADVEGFDALRKICILAGIAFNKIIPTEMVSPVKGITSITALDTEFAEKLGYAVKLLGVCERVGDRIKLLVAPHFVPKKSLIAATSGVFNAISVTGNMLGEAVFYGAGAGSLPTASAVTADVITALSHKELPASPERAENGLVLSEDEIETSLFVRTKANASAITEAFGEIPASCLVEINGETGFILPSGKYGDIKARIDKFAALTGSECVIYFVLN